METAGIKVVEYPTDSEEYRKIMEAQDAHHRELDLLRTNNDRYQRNIETYEKHIAALKKQACDLQAQLLDSQDRITELQQQLLDQRAGKKEVVGRKAGAPQ